MQKSNAPITIDFKKCRPCSDLICIGVCPKGILEIGNNLKPQLISITECTKCGVCADLCPTKAIKIN